MPKLIVKCSNCNKILYKQPRDKRNKHHFCNINCKNKWQSKQKLSDITKKRISEKVSGEKNPMYGKNHSKEIKKIISDKKNDLYKNNPGKKFECGNSRLNKEERFKVIQKGHKKRNSESYSRKLSEEAKKSISISSKNRFTPEFKKLIREKMEREGKWIKLNQKDDFILYKELAAWKKRMWDLISDENQLKLLEKYKIFNPKKNSKGVVRDHKYSRFYGWKNNVFPEILRHPSNCEILKHSDNVKKSRGWKNDENSLTLDQLFEEIKKYSGNWGEHQKCLLLIEKYKNGGRYNKKNYLEKYYE